jgi:hypothetical protein
LDARDGEIEAAVNRPFVTDAAVVAVAEAVFAKPSPWVAEAYSAYDAEPLLFASETEVLSYARSTLAQPRGRVFLFVVYPDMNGRAVRETIHLNPKSVPGHKLRYTWNGLGLISIQLYGEGLHGEGLRSNIAANSQARAEAWAPTYPNWDGPESWNWQAVASHVRRLKRVLKRSM